MLELKEIYKKYLSISGDVLALENINLQFRESEFVAILGPSGGGKTTLLNIIGGLDQYTTGDLIIDGISTREYKDRDWDSYRNHSVGFIFQSYNLIMHQTVVENVELSLTLTGVSKSERRERAIEALKSVGLEDQIYKKPTQLSGGQMQRVAIARALINNPDILLADEPTGALDTGTSVQIMELLKEISKDKLVIMVTHNPDLALTYSTRIISILDGRIVDDTNPYKIEDKEVITKKNKRPSMSFSTALSLSFKNLLTKKGRTFLTAFAGSIGIIGIALILSLSNGIQLYIDKIQKETLSTYPISIEKTGVDMGSLMSVMLGDVLEEEREVERDNDGVYVKPVMSNMLGSMSNISVEKNNLAAFKEYLDSNMEVLKDYIYSIKYGYGVLLNFYVKDLKDEYIRANFFNVSQGLSGSAGTNIMESMSGVEVWQELNMDPYTGEVSKMIMDQYDIVYGKWPTDSNELLLVLNEKNEIPDVTLYSLGLIDRKTILSSISDIILEEDEISFEEIADNKWTYEEICSKPLKFILPTDYYKYDSEENKWVDISDNSSLLNSVIDNGYELKITGIVKPKEDVSSAPLSGSLCYTSKLVEYYIETLESTPMMVAQMKNQEYNLITGEPFEIIVDPNLSNSDKVSLFREYAASLSDEEKSELYLQILSDPNKQDIDDEIDESLNVILEGYEDLSIDSLLDTILGDYSLDFGYSNSLISDILSTYSKDDLTGFLRSSMQEMILSKYKTTAQETIEAIYNTPSDEEIEVIKEQIMMGFNSFSMENLNIFSEYSINLSEVFGILSRFGLGTDNLDMDNIKNRMMKVSVITQSWSSKTSMPMEVNSLYLYTLSDKKLDEVFDGVLTEMALSMYESYSSVLPKSNGEAKVAKAFDEFLLEKEDLDLVYYYDTFIPHSISEISYLDLLDKLGYCEINNPSSISIYPMDFEKKEFIANMIKEYNKTVDVEDRITYIDYMAILMSSVSNIIGAISLSLIAFVSISLVVSNIMIGIITYISVLERTKEIGILRAIGASKRDIGRVFNAESLIIGLASGSIGISVALIMSIPANIIIKTLTDISNVVRLPWKGGVLLIVISVGLTIIAGLIPSRFAATKNPVESLRNE